MNDLTEVERKALQEAIRAYVRLSQEEEQSK